ncbi:unnamed protein product [Umbelopsis ramanniana]
MQNPDPIDEVHYRRNINAEDPENDQDTYHRRPSNSLDVLDDTKKKLTWPQIRLLLISSTGFFMDAYDIFIINLVVPMLGYVYYANSTPANKIPSAVQGPLKGMTSLGQLIGQLAFGYISDRWGRKKIYGVELIIITIATIFCATSASAEAGLSAIAFLGFWRLILGIGIGGDYPLSATITSEWAVANRRGQMIAAIFSMQGFGNVAAALVTIIVLACFKTPVENNVVNLDYVWRICIGLGAVPAVATIYARLTLPESPRYSADVIGDQKAARRALEDQKWVTPEDQERQHSMDANGHGAEYEKAANGVETDRVPIEEDDSMYKENRIKQQQDFGAYFSKWANLKVLLGTSLSWFLMDIAFYGINLNQSIILTEIGFAPTGLSPWDTLFKQAIGNLILSVLGALPGYIVTVFTVEKLGRKPIQYLGFFICGVLFIILGAAWFPIRSVNVALFIVLFAIIQFFFNFGPNTTTFISPAEVFPTRHRSRAHGIAAASGKAGAIISTFGFNALADIGGPPGAETFLPNVLIIFGVIMLLGMVTTLWVPESKGKSLDYFERERLNEGGGIRALFRRSRRTANDENE